MIIPTVQDFKCAIDPDEGISVSVIAVNHVQFTTDNDAIVIQDREQVVMIRDMLTAWISRRDSR